MFVSFVINWTIYILGKTIDAVDTAFDVLSQTYKQQPQHLDEIDLESGYNDNDIFLEY
jgi:hypothetical protein